MKRQKRRKNEPTLWEKILYLGVGRDEFRRDLFQIRRDNRRSLLIICYLGFILMAIMTGLSFVPAAYGYLARFRGIFIAYIIIFAVFAFTCEWILLSRSVLMQPMCYVVMGAVFLLAILLGPVYHTEDLSTTFLVMMFALPLIITDLPVRIVGMLIVFSAAFCVASYLNKASNLFAYDLLNCVAYLMCSIVTAFYTQISKFRQYALQHEIVRQRDTDGLTKLLTKEAGAKRIREIMSANSRKPAALVMMDLDNFKAINDTYGHLFGDAVLSATGRSLLSTFRDGDVLSRFGGDEFVLYLPDADTERSVSSCLNRIQAAFRDNLMVLPNAEHITFSAGVAFFPRNGESYGELLDRADKALYSAKRSGKNQRCFYR